MPQCSEECYRTGVTVLKLPEWGNMPLLPISLCYWSRGGAVVGKQKRKYMGREGKSRRLRGGGTFQSFPLKGALYMCQRLQHEDYVRDSILLYYSFYFCSMYVCKICIFSVLNNRMISYICQPKHIMCDSVSISRRTRHRSNICFLDSRIRLSTVKTFFFTKKKKTYYMFYYINILFVII